MHLEKLWASPGCLRRISGSFPSSKGSNKMLEKPGEEAASLWFSDHFCVSDSDLDPKPVGVHTRYQARNPNVLHQRAERVLASFIWISALLSHSVLPESKFLIWTSLYRKKELNSLGSTLMTFSVKEWIKSSRLKSKLSWHIEQSHWPLALSPAHQPLSCLCAFTYTLASTSVGGEWAAHAFWAQDLSFVKRGK